MDFRLCDRFTDPEGIAERWQSEIPVRLPDSQWCYEPPYEVAPAGPLPRLARGHWTFGSFNQVPKLSEPALIAWAGVLLGIPDSRLIVLGVNDSAAKRRVLATLVGAGVHESRIEIRGRVPIEDYFRTYQDVDVALDTFPYNGGTTTCDALALGVPVAAVAGSHSVSRSAVSLLSAVGLQEWVADDAAGLPDLMRARLADPDALSALRRELPSRFRSSALMDAARFAKGVEDAYRVCWDRCRDTPA
jgi:predicted O-linked N-acetylglucosamine transferase (SPINDLY family)